MNDPVYNVVLADDVDDLRFLVRLALERSGRFRVVGEAADGEQAVRVAEEQQPDVVLLDVSMPRQDGLESLPKIRAASPRSDVIMLTGFEATRLARRAQELGAAGYLEKGLPPDYIVRSVLDIVEGDTSERVVEAPRDTSAPGALSAEDVMAYVAHEVRSPLAVIQGLGLALQERWGELPEDQRIDLVRRMTANATYADSVLTNVEQMRAAAAPTNLQFTIEDPAQLVASFARDLASLTKGRKLELDLADALPDIRVDVHRLRQVVTNLIVNATKYSPEGTAITIGAHPGDPGELVLSITDEGRGIPEDQREAIFDRFMQIDTGTNGLGLGLYIARRLVSALGGRIWVSDGGPGAKICVGVPTA